MDGYAHINGVGAHRLSWQAANGEIPEGLCVLHSCDTRNCVNPLHLFVGTHQDNMDDMARKGRKATQPGELNGNAKLTEAAVLDIQTSTLSLHALARKYGINKDYARQLYEKRHWKKLRNT